MIRAAQPLRRAAALVLLAPLALSGPARAQETAAAQNELRLQQLEDQVRNLTGQVETQSHQIEVLTQQLEKMRAENDVRFNDLEGKGGGSGEGQDVGGLPAQTPQETRAPQGALPPRAAGGPTQLLPSGIAPQQQGPGAPPRVLGQIPAGAVPVSPDQQAAAAAAARAADPQAQYQTAYALINAGHYADAERAFRSFVAQHPKDPLSSSASYWIGHSYYARGDFQNAAVAFADGYKKYPKGVKAPDTLLDLGRSLAKLGNAQDACATFAQFDRQFGAGATASIKKQEQQEKNRLKCG